MTCDLGAIIAIDMGTLGGAQIGLVRQGLVTSNRRSVVIR